MGLFACDKCGTVENTALGDYWTRDPGDKLCSECSTGKWHGEFPKVHESKNEWSKPGRKLNNRPAPPAAVNEAGG